MNISNELKNKVIKHETLTEKEITLFFNYIINKATTISKQKKNIFKKNSMYLLNQICYSYNLLNEPVINKTHTIIELNNEKYLIDTNFNNKKIEKLKMNKYIKYTNNIYKEYLKLTERGNQYE